jgi:hypothetical protein
MKRSLRDLWRCEDGSCTGLEWMLVAQVLVLGSVAILFAIQRALQGN